MPEQIRKQGERDQTLHGERFDKPKLREIGIDYSESHRYQQMAVEAKERQGTRTDITPLMEEGDRGEAAEIAADQAGIGNSNRHYCKITGK